MVVVVAFFKHHLDLLFQNVSFVLRGYSEISIVFALCVIFCHFSHQPYTFTWPIVFILSTKYEVTKRHLKFLDTSDGNYDIYVS